MAQQQYQPYTAVKNAGIPFVGPYRENTNLAQFAYNNALNQYNQQYAQTLAGYGFTPDDANHPFNGAFHADMSNPYSGYSNLLTANQQESDKAERAMNLRGFDAGSGISHQADELAQQDAGGRSYQFFTDLASKLAAINQGKVQSQYNLEHQLLQNQLAEIRAATKGGVFTPAVIQKLIAQQTKKKGRR